MKGKHLALFISMVLVSCSQHKDTIADTQQTPSQLVQVVSTQQAYLVDVRTPEEYAKGHLKYASNVNFKSSDFKTRINQLDKRKPVYVYCQKGGRSKKAADTLEALGFTKVYDIGGLDELSTSGLQTEK